MMYMHDSDWLTAVPAARSEARQIGSVLAALPEFAALRAKTAQRVNRVNRSSNRTPALHSVLA